MNIQLRNLIIASILMSFLLVTSARAAQENGRKLSWKSYAAGIDLALDLDGTKEKPQSRIMVYVRNTSSSVKSLLVSLESDQGFVINVLDDKGSKSLLHEPKHTRGPSGEIISFGSIHKQPINPGETISRGIAVDASDLNLIKNHAIICSFTLIDDSTGKREKVESDPEMLIAKP